MTDEIKIELGIPVPIPGTKRTGTASEALRRLSKSPIGASVLLTKVSRTSIGTLIKKAAGGKWATTAKEGDGTRVWKIAEPEGLAKK